MAAFEFRPSSLTLAVAAAIFLPKQAYAPTEFSFENTYAGANGSIGREIITWPVSGGEPVRWPLAPTEENLAPFLWVEMQQQEGVFDAQTEVSLSHSLVPFHQKSLGENWDRAMGLAIQIQKSLLLAT